jgi:ribosomal protein L11 methyltransferase
VRVLDVGCGSAILAIGAALLGSDAVAFDNDPDTLENARDNVRLNACEGRVSVHIGTIEAIDQSYPVVVANILARVLIELATPLAARAADTLILAGLLHADADAVASAFPDFECRSTLKEGDWSILHLSRVRGAALP